MADDEQSESNVNIQGSANVNSATGQTSATGVKIERLIARDVHVHADTISPPSFRSVALVGVLAFLGAVLINIATGQLPPGLHPYLWLAWPLALLVTAVSIWVVHRQGRITRGSSVLSGSLEQRNRRTMLAKVKNIWIDGLLEQSLAKELRIALDLMEKPDAVDLPLNALVQELRHPPRALPAGTPSIKIFEQMGGALLILGAPGAGKTTLLLELARDLIARAEQDEGHPIPVIFNLSSWAEKRQPLREWLAEELNTKYDVPRKVAQVWMDVDVVLPLLDGLDEVVAEQRSDCVAAINSYRQTHGLVPLIVCSRVADYEALVTKLRLQGAVVVQPLTPGQVEGYLVRAGEKLAGVRAALRDDVELLEIIDTPLMLSIVTLAHTGKSAAEVEIEGTLNERRGHLFNAYMVTMFARRGRETRYITEQTTRYLSWLARKLVESSQTEFNIERIQPIWLPQMKHKYINRVRFLSGVIFVLMHALYVLTGGLFFLMYALLIDSLHAEPMVWIVVPLGVLFFGLLGALFLGLMAGLFFCLFGWIEFELSGEKLGQIHTVEALDWSWIGVNSSVKLALIGGLPTGILFSLSFDGKASLFAGLVAAVVGAVCFGVINIVDSGLPSRKLPAMSYPNQGIWRSNRSAFQVGIIGSLVATAGILFLIVLSTSLVAGASGNTVQEVIVALAAGTFLLFFYVPYLGWIAWLQYGGRAVLQHYTLRWLLYRNGFLPLHLVPFLDYCAERVFLRKVGGGYIFVHRLLMEHFASLYTEDKPAAPPK
jgi:hypothetical protein